MIQRPCYRFPKKKKFNRLYRLLISLTSELEGHLMSDVRYGVLINLQLRPTSGGLLVPHLRLRHVLSPLSNIEVNGSYHKCNLDICLVVIFLLG